MTETALLVETEERTAQTRKVAEEQEEQFVRTAQMRVQSAMLGLRRDWKEHHSGRLLIAQAVISGRAHRRCMADN